MTANGYGLDADAYYQQWSVFQVVLHSMTSLDNGAVRCSCNIS